MNAVYLSMDGDTHVVPTSADPATIAAEYMHPIETYLIEKNGHVIGKSSPVRRCRETISWRTGTDSGTVDCDKGCSE